MSPFEAYTLYLAIKMHFERHTYDFVKYQGKVNAKFEAFDKRRDKYQFTKLAKHRDPKEFLIANFVDGNPGWIGNLFTDEAELIYTTWLSRRQSLTYKVKSDLNLLEDDFVNHFKVKNHQHPNLLVLYKQNKICIETLIILNNTLNFFPMWNEKIDDTILWPLIHTKALKYNTFLEYDQKKFHDLIKNIVLSLKTRIYNSEGYTPQTTTYVEHTT
jgi:hypothetical protein